MRFNIAVSFLILVGMFSSYTSAMAQAVAAQDAILGLFDRYPLVAVGEMHYNVEEHAFLRRLISDPRFPDKATNIVVEFGNARYQSVIDRYISGKRVPPAELSRVWQYTTQFMVWDAPVYAEFFATVRSLNAKRGKSQQLRVWLADPPIDWSKVKKKADYEPFAARDPDAANVIEREILKNGQRALIIVGSAHVEHSDPLQSVRGKAGSPGLVQILDQRDPGKTFAVWPVIGPEVTSGIANGLPIDSLLNVGNSELRNASFSQLAPGPITILKLVHGKRVAYDVKPEDYSKVGDVADAILYLGPVSTKSEAPIETYRDEHYVKDLRFRARIMKEVYGVDFSGDLEEELAKLHSSKN
jgi:hypothetical protein